MNFRTQIRELSTRIRNATKELEREERLEANVRRKWNRKNTAYKKAVGRLRQIKKLHTKLHQSLLAKTDPEWDSESKELTRERNDHRARIAGIRACISSLTAKRLLVEEKENSWRTEEDEIVRQTMALFKSVQTAEKNMVEYVTEHVFSRMFVGGKEVSQITMNNLSETKRIRALVNHMTVVNGESAVRATELIKQFLDRVESDTEVVDANTQAIFDLMTILLESKNFKVSEIVSKFLARKFDEDEFPELAEAQRLLLSSIRIERTSKYIQAFERMSKADNWIRLART